MLEVLFEAVELVTYVRIIKRFLQVQDGIRKFFGSSVVSFGGWWFSMWLGENDDLCLPAVGPATTLTPDLALSDRKECYGAVQGQSSREPAWYSAIAAQVI